MFSRLCKLCHNRADISVVNLRKYRISTTLLRESDDGNSNKPERIPIIVCKQQKFNFYKGKTYTKFETIPLASQGWHHKKSAGDYFTIYPDYQEPDAEHERLAENFDSFENFGLHPKLIENLSFHDIYAPSEIQIRGIPLIMSGQHTILSAETGCGKTFAYLLPLINRIIAWKSLDQDKVRKPNSPYGLIITPSRELAHQIGKEARKLVKDLGIEIKVIIGGRTTKMSKNPSVREVDLLIGTFGVVSKMTTTRIYKLHYVRHVILDESYALFDQSFDDKLEVFLKRIPFDSRVLMSEEDFPIASQLTLVSATRAPKMPSYLQKILDIKSLTDVETNNLHRILVPQKFIRVAALDKQMTLLRLVKPKATKKRPVIIFSNDSPTCDWISLYLNDFGVKTVHLNGQMPMAIRKGKFASFQKGEFMVLSTTNAGARGLDTVHVNNVVNYDFPMETADYIHRCGRTGRIGTKGDCKVTNLISRRLEIELTQKIERAARRGRALPIFDMLEEDAKRFKKINIEALEREKKMKNREKSKSLPMANEYKREAEIM